MKNVMKLTFSLTSLVVCLMFAFATSSAVADHAHTESIAITLRLDENIQDVSSDGGNQVYSGRLRVTPYAEAVSTGTPYTPSDGGGLVARGPAFVFLIEAARVIQMTDDVDSVTPSGTALGLDDLMVDAFDDLERSLGRISLATVLNEEDLPATDYNGDGDTDDMMVPVATIEHKTPGLTQFADPGELPGRQFRVIVYHNALANAYPNLGGAFEIHTLLFTLAPGAATDASLASLTAFNALSVADQMLHPLGVTEGPRTLRADLVGADEGNPRYRDDAGVLITADDPALATRDTWADTTNMMTNPGGYPNVVSITKLTGTSRDITIRETGAFDVKVVLTEEPHADYLENDGANLVEVSNGRATAITRGLTFGSGGEGPRENGDTLRDFTSGVAAVAADVQEQAMPSNYMEGSYDMGLAAVDGTVNTGFDGTEGVEDPIPEPTGRDNRYYSYRVTIVPSTNVTGNVIVTVKRFRDKTLPIAKEYLPIPRQEISSTQLNQMVRNTRLKNGREILTVPIQTGEHKDRADLMAAWKERRDQEDDPRSGLYDQSPFVQEIVGGNHKDLSGFGKFIIPAGGYLVLASGTAATSGIASSPISINRKLTTEQENYNIVYGFGLPSPANDLEAFFRNGGTLNLLYSDIPIATTGVNEDGDQLIGPSHTKGDAGEKEADTDHKDYTGYDGADSVDYEAGDLVISEVMWGLDIILTASQYIELHNPGTEAIEVDPLEWVFVVGSVPSNLSDFTVVDTVGNTPDGVYWSVPGDSGVSGVLTGIADDAPVVARGDLISMSRVMDGTALAADGTAQASWAASMRPSVNLAGRRIGTPGADNLYVMPEMMDDTTTETTTPAAPAAAADDIMISEIMVASNDGRLPQWIELANISGKEVSLNGWSIVINNDPADAAVVGGSVNLVIGDVTVGKDQVVLIVSKAGRNSGVSDRAAGDTNEGDLDSKRIVDVQSQVSPGDDQYMLISEMGFRISLIVSPAAGGVITTSYVVGNLGMEWEVPMAEGNRSSIIRREMGDAAEIMGTDAAGWMLASDTTLGGAHRETYYGQASDVGTPGYDAGGALPVELSGFGAKRDPLTGAVVITWATQSELNNAGFFIKRSQQKDGKFVIVNPTMIAGAGTTAEKQSYTYTDATADPNVIYYYQIEDVSLDGNRQTLTRAHRLKGHIGAAGKATTTWGELKSSRE